MITLNDRITLEEVEKVLYCDEKIKVSSAWMDRVEACYRFLEKFSSSPSCHFGNRGL